MTKKVLLIEDNEFILDMYKIKFEQEGFNVLFAENGIQGLEIAKKEQPDLVLLDLVMPKFDGYQVLQALKGDKTTKNIKVYVLTNLVQDSEIKKSFAIGADGYIIKASKTPQQLADDIKRIFAGETIGIQPKKIEINAKPVNLTSNGGENIGKILIIDDELTIIEMYKIFLEKEGYQVETAQNGAWGLKLAKENKYDVILLDMIMPAMNGYEALKQLKQDGASKDTPVMVLSNSAQDSEVEKAKSLGAQYYFIKSSITPNKIIKQIKIALKK